MNQSITWAVRWLLPSTASKNYLYSEKLAIYLHTKSRICIYNKELKRLGKMGMMESNIALRSSDGHVLETKLDIQ